MLKSRCVPFLNRKCVFDMCLYKSLFTYSLLQTAIKPRLSRCTHALENPHSKCGFEHANQLTMTRTKNKDTIVMSYVQSVTANTENGQNAQ